MSDDGDEELHSRVEEAKRKMVPGSFPKLTDSFGLTEKHPVAFADMDDSTSSHISTGQCCCATCLESMSWQAVPNYESATASPSAKRQGPVYGSSVHRSADASSSVVATSYDVDETFLEVQAGQTVTIRITNRTCRTRQVLLCPRDEGVNVQKSENTSPSYVLVEAKAPWIAKHETTTRTRTTATTTTTTTTSDLTAIGKRKVADSEMVCAPTKWPRFEDESRGRRPLTAADLCGEEPDKLVVYAIKPPPPPPLVETPSCEAAVKVARDLAVSRLRAILRQEHILEQKEQMTVKRRVGALLIARSSRVGKKITWRELAHGTWPVLRDEEQIRQVHPDGRILDVTVANASRYTFSSSEWRQNVVALDLGDSSVMVFDRTGQAGLPEFARGFLAMPGVDPKLVADGWIDNHYKWIVWKLAALDCTRLGHVQLPKCLTPQRVMSKLKYRYDRDIDLKQWSALRRIAEQVDVASWRVILCISSIEKCADEAGSNAEPQWKVKATDGWYEISLTIDRPMAHYISEGLVWKGTKIVTYGAELIGCDASFHPLTEPFNASLEVHANCMRRARWDAKLGFQVISRPIPFKLASIVKDGGMVGMITATAARIYPVLYGERGADGTLVYRNERCEARASAVYNQVVNELMDALYAASQEELDRIERSRSEGDLEAIQAKEELERNLMERASKVLPAQRDVTSLLNIRLCDETDSAVLSIWGVGEECTIEEGNSLCIYNCSEAGLWDGVLSLTTNQLTRIEFAPRLELPNLSCQCTLIPDVGAEDFQPEFDEFEGAS